MSVVGFTSSLLRSRHHTLVCRANLNHAPFFSPHLFHHTSPSSKALFPSSAVMMAAKLASTSSRTTLVDAGPREKILLTGAEEMLLPVVFFKARDAKSEKPILGDPFSQQLLDSCVIDYSKTHFTQDYRYVTWINNRAKRFDIWCQEFIDAHQGQRMTVLHLACGLDCRYMRVKTGPNVRWIDVDLPLVVELRQRILPTPPGDYSLRTLQITKPNWYRDIPEDRPTLVIAEGLTMYLEPKEGEQVLKDVAGYFKEGQIVFDTLGSLSSKFTSYIKVLKSSGSSWKWGIDDPQKQIAMLHPKLKLQDQIVWGDFMDSHPPLFGNFLTPAAAAIFPRFKNNIQLLRFGY